MANILSPKFQAETVNLKFDFSNLISDPTEIISYSSWTVSVLTGIDAAPNNILIGSPVTSNTSVTRLVGAGVQNANYKITVLATTNKNQVFRLDATMKIV